MPISPMQNIEYRCCVLCGKKRVAPINRNPPRYPKYGACPMFKIKSDFEITDNTVMFRFRESITSAA